MQIENAISDWFSQLSSQLNKIKDDELILGYITNISELAKDYSESVLILLRNGKPLAAHTVLRTLAELVIKFCWCIKDARKDRTSFYSKAEIWTKHSLSEHLRYLKRAHECFNDKRIQNNIDNVTNSISKLKDVQDMPNNLVLCKELFTENGILYYHILFGGMNPVVHPNLETIQRLGIVQNGELAFEANDRMLLEQLGMTCVYLIIEYIFKYYKIDLSSIKQDYEKLKR